MLGRLAQRLAIWDATRLLWLEIETLAPAAGDDGRLEFRFLSADEVRGFAVDAENCLDAALADELASGGNICFAALTEGRLAAYGWYALGAVDPRHSGGVSLGLPAGAAYFYNGFTRPEFRGRGVYAALMGEGLRVLAERGIRGVLASVGWTNRAALQSCRRLGFRDLGLFASVGRGRWRLMFPPARPSGGESSSTARASPAGSHRCHCWLAQRCCGAMHRHCWTSQQWHPTLRKRNP